MKKRAPLCTTNSTAAYETAGDKSSALKHFMEVYGRNIDYRDVAERIKPLKS